MSIDVLATGLGHRRCEFGIGEADQRNRDAAHQERRGRSQRASGGHPVAGH